VLFSHSSVSYSFSTEDNKTKEDAKDNKDTDKEHKADKSKEEATDESKVKESKDKCEEPTINEGATVEDKNPTPPKKAKLEGKAKSA
jgi:hypothetical protein